MFGQNKTTKPFPDLAGSLKVVGLWYTIQGEGPDAGRPAMFLRLSHCNLKCYFCDTNFEDGTVIPLTALRDEILKVSREKMCNFMVITGGEPFLQNLCPLVAILNSRGISVSVETAGTVYAEGLEKHFAADRSIHDNLIVCSPKTPKLNEQVIPLIGALKYVVASGQCSAQDGLPMKSTQVKDKEAILYRPCDKLTPGTPIYLQPLDDGTEAGTRQNMNYAAWLCMQHQYRMSVQMHKMLGLE